MERCYRKSRPNHDSESSIPAKIQAWSMGTPEQERSQPQPIFHDFSHVDLFSHAPQNRPPVQMKLTVGALRDKYEEADRSAQQGVQGGSVAQIDRSQVTQQSAEVIQRTDLYIDSQGVGHKELPPIVEDVNEEEPPKILNPDAEELDLGSEMPDTTSEPHASYPAVIPSVSPERRQQKLSEVAARNQANQVETPAIFYVGGTKSDGVAHVIPPAPDYKPSTQTPYRAATGAKPFKLKTLGADLNDLGAVGGALKTGKSAKADQVWGASSPQEVKPLAPGTGSFLDEHLKQRIRVIEKAEEIGTGGAVGSLQEEIGKLGLRPFLEKLLQLKEPTGKPPKNKLTLADPRDTAVDRDLNIIRMLKAVGKWDEAVDFIEVVRKHEEDLDRLLMNKPKDVERLLIEGEFKTMKSLIKAEVKYPQARLRETAQGAHHFHEHGAHLFDRQQVINAADFAISKGMATSRKGNWKTSKIEKQATGWAKDQVKADVSLVKNATDRATSIAAFNTLNGVAADLKHLPFLGGGVNAVTQVISDNSNFPDPRDRWTCQTTGIKPTSVSEFAQLSEPFSQPQQFKWFRRNGSVGGTKSVPTLFKVRGGELRAVEATNADAGIAGEVSGSSLKVSVSVAPVPAPAHKYASDPEAPDPVVGTKYLHTVGATTYVVEVLEIGQPALTGFKVIFRKTTDNPLKYTVFTAYPG